MSNFRVKILTITFIIEGGAAVLAMILAWYFDIRLFPISNNVIGDLMMGTLYALPPFAFFLFSLSRRAENIPLIGPLRKKIITEIKSMFDSMNMIDLLLISLLAGIGEELLFRGIVQVKFGLIIASVVFGLMHSISLAYVIVTIIMGLYIGGIYQSSGSLLVPVQLHFAYDFAALMYLRYYVRTPDDQKGDS